MKRTTETLPGTRRAWRWLVLALSGVLLVGCNSISRDSVQTLVVATKGIRDFRPTPEQVAASPYAQILVEGPLGNALMVLGNADPGRTAWYSNDKRAVFLDDGLLVGTQGQPQDAMRVAILGDNPFPRLLSVQTPVTVQREYDWMPGYRYGVRVTGTLRRAGTEDIQILGRTLRLEHFEEDLRGDGVDARNAYWVDPRDGRIVRSRQLVAPGLSLQITTLKAYRARTTP